MTIERNTEKVVEAAILLPVAVASGVVKGVGSAFKKLTDWI